MPMPPDLAVLIFVIAVALPWVFPETMGADSPLPAPREDAAGRAS